LPFSSVGPTFIYTIINYSTFGLSNLTLLVTYGLLRCILRYLYFISKNVHEYLLFRKSVKFFIVSYYSAYLLSLQNLVVFNPVT